MEITINTSETRSYKFRRSTEEEIVQNLENIVSRIKGNVVLDRQKGISKEFIDQPTEYVKAHIIASVMEEIEREEKRFEVETIEVTGDDLARLIIKITGEVLS